MAFLNFKEKQRKHREAPYPFPGRGLEKWALQPYASIDYMDKIKHRSKKTKQKKRVELWNDRKQSSGCLGGTGCKGAQGNP